MYICICHSVTDKAIRKAVKDGHDSLEAIQCTLKAGTCCGRCKSHVIEEIDKTKNQSGLDFGLAIPLQLNYS